MVREVEGRLIDHLLEDAWLNGDQLLAFVLEEQCIYLVRIGRLVMESGRDGGEVPIPLTVKVMLDVLFFTKLVVAFPVFNLLIALSALIVAQLGPGLADRSVLVLDLEGARDRLGVASAAHARSSPPRAFVLGGDVPLGEYARIPTGAGPGAPRGGVLPVGVRLLPGGAFRGDALDALRLGDLLVARGALLLGGGGKVLVVVVVAVLFHGVVQLVDAHLGLLPGDAPSGALRDGHVII